MNNNPLNALGAGPERMTDQPVSRFWPRYRKLTENELNLHDAIRHKAEELAQLMEQAPPSRERSLAITNLEQAVMWSIRGITA